MNLHQAGIEPPAPAPPPPSHLFYGNDRLVYEFIEVYSTNELFCVMCGGFKWARMIYERWSSEEQVDFSSTTDTNPEAQADVSSAEYDDAIDEDSWACTNCGNSADRGGPLVDLLNDMDKERY